MGTKWTGERAATEKTEGQAATWKKKAKQREGHVTDPVKQDGVSVC